MFTKENAASNGMSSFRSLRGWKLYGEDIQPIEQVQTEVTQSYFFFQVPVHSRHDRTLTGIAFLPPMRVILRSSNTRSNFTGRLAGARRSRLGTGYRHLPARTCRLVFPWHR